MEKIIENIKTQREQLKAKYYEFKKLQEKEYDLVVKAIEAKNEQEFLEHNKLENEYAAKYDHIRHAINDLGNSLYFLTGERVETFWG